jgi:hypothetical protein
VERQGKVFRAVAAIESRVRVGKYVLGDLLEGGTRYMGARPYKEQVKGHAMPKIKALYGKPYTT